MVAVCSDRLVAIICIEPDGVLTVRDLATSQVHATAAFDLKALPRQDVVQSGPFLTAKVSDAHWEQAQRRKEAADSIEDAQNMS